MHQRNGNNKITVRRFAGPVSYISHFKKPLRVVHLTDLHVGRMTPFRLHEDAVELTNAAKPELVVITGDFVCHSQLYLNALEYLIAGFKSPVMTVLGNHDHWSGAEEVRKSLKRAGAEVLDNANTLLCVNGRKLQVVGIDDAYTGYSNIKKAVKGLKKNIPAIGLSHIAEEADILWKHGIPLVFSGHTHGGQITVARMHELTLGRLGGHRYIHGLYGRRFKGACKEKDCGVVYVGAGIGASVMPLRMGDRGRREITVFDLGLKPGSFTEDHEEQSPLPGRIPSELTKARRIRRVHNREIRRMRMSA